MTMPPKIGSESPTATVTRHDLLVVLDQAITDQLAWLSEWHRDLLCGEPSAPGDLADDPDHLGRFGSWFIQNQHKGLANQPAVHALARLHREMHDLGRHLRRMGRAGHPLPQDEYEAFSKLGRDFVAQARRLEKAFTAASSDLDALTGLHNRQAMDGDLEREYARFARSGHAFSIALADIDFFKKVNDTYGHAFGDRVLVAAAESFLRTMRPYDNAYRYGGEEFLFCLLDVALPQAQAAAERLRTAMADQTIVAPNGERLQVTASFGVAEASRESTVAGLIKRADEALYAAKAAGRNRVCGWTAGGIVEAGIA